MIAAMTIPMNLGRRLLLVPRSACCSRSARRASARPHRARPLPPTSTSIVVKLRDAADAGALRTAPGVQAVDAFLPDAAAIGRRSAARHAGRDARGPGGAAADAMALEAGFARTFIVRVTGADAVEATLARFRQDPAVEYAERDAPMAAQWTPTIPTSPPRGRGASRMPTLSGLHRIQAAAAWDVSRGAGIVVAVTDTGIDARTPTSTPTSGRTPARSPATASTTTATATSTTSTAGTSSDTEAIRTRPRPRHARRRHVAAEGNNGDGIVGVGSERASWPVKVLGDFGSGLQRRGAAEHRLCGDERRRRHQRELGRREPLAAARGDRALRLRPWRPRGGRAPQRRPRRRRLHAASISEAVTVAASDHLDGLWPGSNRGIGVDVTAPGVGILSLRASRARPVRGGTHVVGGRYYWATDTSTAAGYVSGAIATILSRFPEQRSSATRDRRRSPPIPSRTACRPARSAADDEPRRAP